LRASRKYPVDSATSRPTCSVYSSQLFLISSSNSSLRLPSRIPSCRFAGWYTTMSETSARARRRALAVGSWERKGLAGRPPGPAAAGTVRAAGGAEGPRDAGPGGETGAEGATGAEAAGAGATGAPVAGDVGTAGGGETGRGAAGGAAGRGAKPAGAGDAGGIIGLETGGATGLGGTEGADPGPGGAGAGGEAVTACGVADG
jgi:hypothetical protein